MNTRVGTVGVIGAGTMGAGIAQVAAVAGHRVLLVDAVPGLAARAAGQIRKRVREQVAKGRLDADPRALELKAADIGDLAGCGLVVEAVVEDIDAKRRLFAEVEKVVAADCALASNTSSLSVTALSASLRRPERLVGMHFFNPVHAMRLVEVVSGLGTSAEMADLVASLAADWGKTVVKSADTPGFIVNRIARPFYAEAWRLMEERAATPAVIDAVLTGAAGFRMGPFALMDLIGHDVNEAVTRSVWSAFGNDPRFAPSLTQRALVDAGRLGRKAGRGVYSYAKGATPEIAAPAAPAAALVEASEQGGLLELPAGAVMARCAGQSATALAAAIGRPAIVVDRTLDDRTASAIAIAASDGCPPAAVGEAIGLLQAAGLAVYPIDDVPGLIVTRTVAMLANLAADALARQVASASDIDTAMRLGTNYPLGPLAWADQWGARAVLAILDEMEDWYRDGHYRASPLLRRVAHSGTRMMDLQPTG